MPKPHKQQVFYSNVAARVYSLDIDNTRMIFHVTLFLFVPINRHILALSTAQRYLVHLSEPNCLADGFRTLATQIFD